jgi:hypothetical protein
MRKAYLTGRAGVPRQTCLCTPELQWQPRAKMAYLTGEGLGWGGGAGSARDICRVHHVPVRRVRVPQALTAGGADQAGR